MKNRDRLGLLAAAALIGAAAPVMHGDAPIPPIPGPRRPSMPGPNSRTSQDPRETKPAVKGNSRRRLRASDPGNHRHAAWAKREKRRRQRQREQAARRVVAS